MNDLGGGHDVDPHHHSAQLEDHLGLLQLRGLWKQTEGSQHDEDMMVAPAGASSTSRLQVVTSSHCWLTSPRAASLHSTSYTAEERCDS